MRLFRHATLIFLFVFPSFSQEQEIEWSIFGSSEPEPTLSDVVQSFDEIRRLLDESFKRPPACHIRDGVEKSELCTSGGLCKHLAQNLSSGNLYVDAEGRPFRNQGLRFLEGAVEACFLNAVYGQRSPISAVQARRDFLNSVKSNGEEKLMVEHELAAVDVAETIAFENPDYTSRDLLEAIKKKVSKPFSKGTQKLFEAYVLGTDWDPGEEPPEWSPLDANVFWDTSLARDEEKVGGGKKLAEYQEKFQKEVDRSAKLFEEAKAVAIKTLEKRRTAKNKDEISNLIERVRTLRLDVNTFGDDFYQEDDCSGINASYALGIHSVVLCSQSLELPSGMLHEILLHEIGHAIDPCVSSLELHKREEDENAVEIGFDPKISGNPDEKYEVESLLPPLKVFTLFGRTEEEEEPEVVFESMKPDRYPFRSVVDCLKKDTSVGARTLEREKAEQVLKEHWLVTQYKGETNRKIDKLYADARARLSKHRECATLSIGSPSQTSEAFADWFAAEAIGDQIESSGKSPYPVEEFALLHAASFCKSPPEQVYSEASKLFKKYRCPNPYDDSDDPLNLVRHAMGHLLDSHSLSSDRIDRILMADPRIRKALGCKGRANAIHCK